MRFNWKQVVCLSTGALAGLIVSLFPPQKLGDISIPYSLRWPGQPWVAYWLIPAAAVSDPNKWQPSLDLARLLGMLTVIALVTFLAVVGFRDRYTRRQTAKP